jgi:hypothetical protein
MRTPLALLVSAALLFPVAVLTAPAEAGTSDVTITNCAKTRHGVTVRIKIRDEGSRGRVRNFPPAG